MAVELEIDPGHGDIDESDILSEKVVGEVIKRCAEHCIFFENCDAARIGATNAAINAAAAAQEEYDRTGDISALREAENHISAQEKQRFNSINEFETQMQNCDGWTERVVETRHRPPEYASSGPLGQLAVAIHHRTVKVCKNSAAEQAVRAGVNFLAD